MVVVAVTVATTCAHCGQAQIVVRHEDKEKKAQLGCFERRRPESEVSWLIAGELNSGTDIYWCSVERMARHYAALSVFTNTWLAAAMILLSSAALGKTNTLSSCWHDHDKPGVPWSEAGRLCISSRVSRRQVFCVFCCSVNTRKSLLRTACCLVRGVSFYAVFGEVWLCLLVS